MKKIATLFYFLVITAALTIPLNNNFAFAQVVINPDLRPTNAVYMPVSNTGTSETGMSSAANVANTILQLIAGSLIYAAGPLAVLMIAVGGFRYVISHGDQTQMESAKKNITWAIIGLLVILVSWIIVSSIIKLLTTIA
jgi:hypothetical protein